MKIFFPISALIHIGLLFCLVDPIEPRTVGMEPIELFLRTEPVESGGGRTPQSSRKINLLPKKKVHHKRPRPVSPLNLNKTSVNRKRAPVQERGEIKKTGAEGSSKAMVGAGQSRGPLGWRPFRPAPVYPGLAKRLGLSGKVLLEVETNAKGFVNKIRVAKSSGVKILDEAALEGVRAWRLHPNLYAKIPIEFQLKE